MVTNRIQKYNAIWANHSQPKPQPLESIPPGFAPQLLNHLSPEQQQAIAMQKELYLWAYQEARRQSDQRLFSDWSI